MRFVPLSLIVFKRMSRDLFTLFFAILFPAFFVFIFSMAFGKTGPMRNQRFDLAVVNRDEGVRVNFGAGPDTLRLGRALVGVLESLSYSRSSGWMSSDSSSSGLAGLDSLRFASRRPESAVFNVADTLQEAEALRKVSSGDYDAALMIPAGFTRAAMATAMQDATGRIFLGAVDRFSARSGSPGRKPTAAEIQNMIDDFARGPGKAQKKPGTSLDSLSLPSMKAAPATLRLAGDPSNLGFTMTGGIVKNVLDQFLKSVSRRSLEEAKEFLPAGLEPAGRDLVSLENSSVAVRTRTVFDYQVPGIIVFALLMLVSLVSVTLMLDLTQGHLERLKLTRMSTLDYFVGNTLPWLALSVVQLALLFGAAKLFGYHNVGSMFAGVGLVVLGSLSSIALALIVASMAKNEKQASIVSTMIAVPVSFLSGAFFPVRDVVILKDFFGHRLALTDLSPWTHTTRALVATLTFGKGFSAVRWDVLMQAILTVVLFLVGVLLFSRRRLTAQR